MGMGLGVGVGVGVGLDILGIIPVSDVFAMVCVGRGNGNIDWRNGSNGH